MRRPPPDAYRARALDSVRRVHGIATVRTGVSDADIEEMIVVAYELGFERGRGRRSLLDRTRVEAALRAERARLRLIHSFPPSDPGYLSVPNASRRLGRLAERILDACD